MSDTSNTLGKTDPHDISLRVVHGLVRDVQIVNPKADMKRQTTFPYESIELLYDLASIHLQSECDNSPNAPEPITTVEWADVAVALEKIAQFAHARAIQIAIDPPRRRGRPRKITTTHLKAAGASDGFIRRVQRIRQEKKESQKKD